MHKITFTKPFHMHPLFTCMYVQQVLRWFGCNSLMYMILMIVLVTNTCRLVPDLICRPIALSLCQCHLPSQMITSQAAFLKRLDAALLVDHHVDLQCSLQTTPCQTKSMARRQEKPLTWSVTRSHTVDMSAISVSARASVACVGIATHAVLPSNVYCFVS